MPNKRRTKKEKPEEPYNPEKGIEGIIEDRLPEREIYENEDPEPDPNTDPKEEDPLKGWERKRDREY
jgi:hypothetical protein